MRSRFQDHGQRLFPFRVSEGKIHLRQRLYLEDIYYFIVWRFIFDLGNSSLAKNPQHKVHLLGVCEGLSHISLLSCPGDCVFCVITGICGSKFNICKNRQVSPKQKVREARLEVVNVIRLHNLGLDLSLNNLNFSRYPTNLVMLPLCLIHYLLSFYLLSCNIIKSSDEILNFCLHPGHK